MLGIKIPKQFISSVFARYIGSSSFFSMWDKVKYTNGGGKLKI
jgi:hypothetical protein